MTTPTRTAARQAARSTASVAGNNSHLNILCFIPAPFYAHLKAHLLALPGMSAQPYHSQTGKGPAGSMKEFRLAGRPFVTLRLTDSLVTVYAGPILGRTTLTEHLQTQLKPLRSSKGCFKIIKPAKAETALKVLFTEALRQWEP